MADKTQVRTVSQTGSVLGDAEVTESQNQVAPQRETAILSFECPRNFERLSYVGQRDATRFVPRTTESISAGTGDDTVVNLNANIQPVAGETDVAEQDYPVCVAYNTDTSTQYDIVDVDYSANTVTLGTNPSDTETVKLWPIMSEGDVNVRLVNQFGQVEGKIYPWSTPLYRWHDFPQLQRGREINLRGSVSWQENETVEVVLDAPQQITWTDSDYPNGSYVSTFNQDLEITL